MSRYSVEIKQQDPQGDVKLRYSRWTDGVDVEETDIPLVTLDGEYITEPMVLLSVAIKGDDKSKIVTTPSCPPNMVGFDPKTDLGGQWSDDVRIMKSSYKPFPKYAAFNETINDTQIFMDGTGENVNDFLKNAEFETLILPKSVKLFNKNLLQSEGAITIHKLILQYNTVDLEHVLNNYDNIEFFNILDSIGVTVLYFQNGDICDKFKEFMYGWPNDRIFVFDKYIEEMGKDIPDITT